MKWNKLSRWIPTWQFHGEYFISDPYSLNHNKSTNSRPEIHFRLDPRLDLRQYVNSDPEDTFTPYLTLNEDHMQKIWTPQIWMSNAIASPVTDNSNINLLGGEQTFFTVSVEGTVT